MRVDWCVCVVVVSYQEYSLTRQQVMKTMARKCTRARYYSPR